MSTIKTVNLQHPSSANINLSVESTGSVTLQAAPFLRNNPNVYENYTISNTYNEMSVGPITLGNNVTVTVNGEWVIV
jgi:hypothetical protein